VKNKIINNLKSTKHIVMSMQQSFV